jgi:DNA-binding protein YbaB
MKLRINYTSDQDEFTFDAEGDFTIEQAHELISEVVGGGVVIEELKITEQIFYVLDKETIEQIREAAANSNLFEPDEDDTDATTPAPASS